MYCHLFMVHSVYLMIDLPNIAFEPKMSRKCMARDILLVMFQSKMNHFPQDVAASSNTDCFCA